MPIFSRRRHRGEEQTDSLSDSEGRISRHSSIQGPYRSNEPASPSFPVYSPVEETSPASQVYSRALFSLGNGFGISNVAGDTSRPKEHIRDGALIGDVGYMNTSAGTFDFCFNIFLSSNHPIQPEELPENFSPFRPMPTKEDIVIVKDFFPPHSALASEGIDIARTTDTPLKVEFSVAAPEGAILILPKGAMREELIDPTVLHPYIKEHAVSWYQYFNGSNDHTKHTYPIPNGTIWIITGVDLTDSWAMATMQNRTDNPKRGSVKIIYDEENPDVFQDEGFNFPPEYRKKQLSDDSRVPIFIRVLAVALTPSEWTKHIAYIPEDYSQAYGALSIPDSRLRSRMNRLWMRIRASLNDIPSKPSERCFFHPSIVLLHILLFNDTTGSVGIVGDEVWCTQLQKKLLTHPEVVQLVRRIIDKFEVVNSDGIIRFVPKRKESESGIESQKRKGLTAYVSYVKPWSSKTTKSDSQARYLRNMQKVLSISK
ncbi:hypothetical protein HYPSUDRAFT_42617 [Hypholoma sublateritium FD-334 SS-4]|uniref:Uncharacterized protein n=1 Tax=Hypholoma sublateritium (strain FD-334 SS-4) TaxID=945553 RepID=A0A0D2NWF2_HYPSF|nr:hypothetical protein HYPSUDRAFT_42617 [Hypholoma sublateritium FD-334 SS-4]